MNPLTRLAGAAIVALLAAGVVFLGMRPSSNIGPPAATSPAPSIIGSVAPTIELPAARALAPAAVIDLAGMVKDTIPLTTDGTDVWVGVDGAVIHIDGRTNATRRLDVPNMSTGNGEIVMASDGLWIEDYSARTFERVDPTTGTVEISGTAPDSPRTIFFVDDQLWIGARGAYLVDRGTAALGPRIGNTNDFAIGLGDVWLGGQSLAADAIVRYDSSSGALNGTIDVPPGTGCYVAGSFPDNIWAACRVDFGTCPSTSAAVRIDPATNTVVTTARVCGGPVAVIDGTPWFLAGRKDGTENANSLVSVDPGTGRLLAQVDLGRIDPNAIALTATALWISDEQGDRVVRYDLVELRR